jgi:hypothetical protein
MQEAYIVTGYRTAVGKAKRGGFRFIVQTTWRWM